MVSTSDEKVSCFKTDHNRYVPLYFLIRGMYGVRVLASNSWGKASSSYTQILSIQKFLMLQHVNSFIRSVTEPYLKVFRKRIPPVGGFDISAIPAIFILDLVGQATAALGAEFPLKRRNLETDSKLLSKKMKLHTDKFFAETNFKFSKWCVQCIFSSDIWYRYHRYYEQLHVVNLSFYSPVVYWCMYHNIDEIDIPILILSLLANK